MDDDVEQFERGFRPLRPESRARLISTTAAGSLFWLVALDIGILLFYRFDEIVAGVLAVIASFLLAAIVLSLLWLGRRRQERRHARGA